MSLLGPFSKGFPVAFRSDGDTTRDAFGKHIQEIDRIYGYLNALDAGKASADEISGSLGDLNTVLTQHINSSNPHPNWKPSFSFSDLSGTVDASKVSGKLTQATIDASRVNGLTALITGSIPEAGGDGITSSNLAGNGYVKFKNGLIIQWGVHTKDDAGGKWEHSVTFPIPFPNICYTVTATCNPNNDSDEPKNWGDDSEHGFYINNWDKNGFRAISYVEDFGGTGLNFIAIGK